MRRGEGEFCCAVLCFSFVGVGFLRSFFRRLLILVLISGEGGEEERGEWGDGGVAGEVRSLSRRSAHSRKRRTQ